MLLFFSSLYMGVLACSQLPFVPSLPNVTSYLTNSVAKCSRGCKVSPYFACDNLCVEHLRRLAAWAVALPVSAKTKNS